MVVEIRTLEHDRLADVVAPIGIAMGFSWGEEGVQNFGKVPELDLRLGAFDGDAVVGGGASFLFEMTVPGGPVETSGLTVVGVLPTHRRRGILRDLMRRYIDAVRERPCALSALWASEAPIYGRFGYGMASLSAEISLVRDRAHFIEPTPFSGTMRLVEADEALRTFPTVWERVRAAVPGMLSRSEVWWRERRLADQEWQRRGRGPLQRMLLEHHGEPTAYALYRLDQKWEHFVPTGSLDVAEAVGATPQATRELWRYLLDADVVDKINAGLLPVDHPLLLLTSEPRRLSFRLADALWIRVVDVEAALNARSYAADGALVLEISDGFCPWNDGRWQIAGGRVARSDDEPDLRLDVSALGSAFLGAFSWRELAEAGRVQGADEALERADSLFRTPRAPWCPEIF